MNIHTSNSISFANLLNPSDPDESGADVVLWMGPEKEPIYAHSNILRNASNYYKAAFSSRWKRRRVRRATSNTPDNETIDLDASDDTVSVANLIESLQTTPSEHSSRSTSTGSSRTFEIHHPEYEKRHMIQVLHYMYRVPMTIETEDALDVAVIAKYLLISELLDMCLSHITESAEDVDKCAFKLYSLAATTFLDSKSELMDIVLELICESFEVCINAIQDVASLKKREIEALLIGLSLSPEQKWILLIVWAMATTGMMDATCDNAVKYAFKESEWKEKLDESFEQTVKDLVHLIPFVQFSKYDYIHFVQPFKVLGVLKANLEDFLIYSFESEELNVQDPQLVASVRQRYVIDDKDSTTSGYFD